MNTRKLIASSLFAAFATAAAHAGGDVIYYNADERPDPAMVARILGGAPVMRAAEVPAPTVRTRSIRTRSIQLLETSEPAPQMVAAAEPSTYAPAPVAAEPAPDGLALPVQFAFDSADLAPNATFQLDAVAEGIRMAGSSVRVVIEGHTDAVGSDDYNRRLSHARAQAVKQYLIYRHGITAEQLVVEGHGEANPIEPGNPFAARNRRVEFRAARG
ncbi:MAG: OmpA family protein [Rhodocyclaceae bacterium]|nr:OmpA family protein [Rhodocyclaceae bacterium]